MLSAMSNSQHGGARFLVFFVALLPICNGFYLPGVKMETYTQGDPIPLYVNSLTSSETLLPMEYYRIPFCRPNTIEYKSENLGEYLTANRIENSPYDIEFLEDKLCAVLCTSTYDNKKIKLFDGMIKDGYRVNWILDNLPVTSVGGGDANTAREAHELGFPLGRYNPTSEKMSQLNNHVRIRIGYNIPPDLETSESSIEKKQGRIVNFVAYPASYDYKKKDFDQKNNKMTSCSFAEGMPSPLYLNIENKDANQEVYWTYSVEWIEEKTLEWRTRWDVFFELGSGSDDVHWFSIINALLIVLFLSGMVGMILMRSLHRDISRYNRVPTEEERAEEREESGWKLVHADVFRPPSKHPMLFCVMAGTGVQLLCMALLTLLFAAIGFLSPSNRGYLVDVLLVMFVLMGMTAGYTSSRTYKMFKGKNWNRCTILTAFLFPGIVFGIFFLLNLFAWGAGSDAAVPFGSMMVVVVLWFAISVPLVFAGAWFGYKAAPITFPVATSNIPRPIPLQPWYMTNVITGLVGGILPFGAIFVELFFILTSLWTNRYYYVFGFLLLAFIILLNTCAEITIVLCYFQLCGEDYHWWWRSFIVSGSCGFYVFLYSAYYYASRLDVHNVIGAMLYFGYMSAISAAIFALTGTVGYFSCLWFTKKIYASIKVD